MIVTKLHVGWGVLAVSALVAASTGAALAAEPAAPKNVTFSKDVAPIIQAKCQSCHEPGSIAPMPLVSYQDVRPWARSIRERVAKRQMPPWHIDRSVGVQKFKNDMSLTDEQIAMIVAWVDAGAPQGDPKDLPPAQPVATSLYWQAEHDGYGPPDIIIKSGERTMPALHQDAWWRPVVDIPVTEPRWVRMVEIRPSNLKGRKILHHSVAYQVLNPDNVEAVNTGIGRGFGGPTTPDLINSRPMLMEWAIGKGYDRYMDGTGKLIMPGEKIAWDEHIHAAGEEITAGSELGIWLYPKGQEPKKRSYLVPFTGLKNDRTRSTFRRTRCLPRKVSRPEENTLITNFQPHCPAARPCWWRRFCLMAAPRPSATSRTSISVDDQLHLRRRRGAGVPQGDGDPCRRLLRQHYREQEQPGSGAVGRLRRPHCRRDGACVDERLLPVRRRVQPDRRGAEGQGPAQYAAIAEVGRAS
jgi:cytochrome c553